MDLQRDPPNIFAGSYVDRRPEAREAAAWLDEARADPGTRYVLSYGTTHLVHGENPTRILFLPGDHLAVRTTDERKLVLLGWFKGERAVLVELDSPEAPALPEGARFEELRPLTSRLPVEEAGLLAYSRALSIWRSKHRFCGVCGSPTAPARAGHVLRCTNPECGNETFPRIDPAVIVIVTDGDRALLGRQPSWPAGRYSTVAGFVEPGESLEDAVAREVLEETGVRLTAIHYHSSQPWPFPSSLMVGFQAVAQPGDLALQVLQPIGAHRPVPHLPFAVDQQDRRPGLHAVALPGHPISVMRHRQRVAMATQALEGLLRIALAVEPGHMDGQCLQSTQVAGLQHGQIGQPLRAPGRRAVDEGERHDAAPLLVQRGRGRVQPLQATRQLGGHGHVVHPP